MDYVDATLIIKIFNYQNHVIDTLNVQIFINSTCRQETNCHDFERANICLFDA